MHDTELDCIFFLVLIYKNPEAVERTFGIRMTKFGRTKILKVSMIKIAFQKMWRENCQDFAGFSKIQETQKIFENSNSQECRSFWVKFWIFWITGFIFSYFWSLTKIRLAFLQNQFNLYNQNKMRFWETLRNRKIDSFFGTNSLKNKPISSSHFKRWIKNVPLRW